MLKDEPLTFYHLLEIIGAILSILVPILGIIWYGESKFNNLDTRLIRIESTLDCTINTMSKDIDPSICIGD